MNKNIYILLVFPFFNYMGLAQTLKLQQVLDTIELRNPQIQMMQFEIQGMDVMASGVKSWMNPQINTGFFMSPYNANMWSQNPSNSGMGSYMVGVSQMFPNFKKQNAEFAYLSSRSSVEKNRLFFTINELKSQAKSNYTELLIIEKKLAILQQNMDLLNFIISSIEIRYELNTAKLSDYYKAQAEKGNLETMKSMLLNEKTQKRIALNTLMSIDKNYYFQIDTTYAFINYAFTNTDSVESLSNRSEIMALNESIKLNDLRIEVEKTEYRPTFGVKYDHMFVFGQNPQMFNLMGMISIPMPYSTRETKANISGLKIRNQALESQKAMVINETSGMLNSLQTNLQTAHSQYKIYQNVIGPALKKYHESTFVAWQNNDGSLRDIVDSWQAMYIEEMNSLDKLQSILQTQIEIERLLEI